MGDLAEYLKRLEEEKNKAKVASPPAPSPEDKKRAELERLKAELKSKTVEEEKMKAKQAEAKRRQEEEHKSKAAAVDPMAAEIEALKKQLAQKDALLASLASDTTTTAAASAPRHKTDSSNREDELKLEIEKLKRANSNTAATKSISESAKREEALRKEVSEMQKSISSSSSSKTATTATTATSASAARISDLQKQLESLKAKAANPTATASTSSAAPSETAVRISELERQKQKLLEQLSSGPSKTELETTRRLEKAQTDKILYGIDVCFLMDCTGSMSSFIKAAKDKVYEIIAEITKNENKATLRFAFVGYRDHCDGAERLVSVDFVDEIRGSPFESTLSSCEAKGGGDAPEDVAGGLDVCTTLSWLCSTRLLIHFGDAPCHGTNYHDCHDSHPGGDPLGLKPEDLLQKLINKRVDYYFMKINTTTDKMTTIFQNVYERVQQKFTVIPVDASATDFVPKVVNSIRSSMARSAAYRR